MSTQSRVVHSTAQSFSSDVVDSKQPVVVDFYADWCGPCRIVSPIIEQLSQEYDGRIRFVKVDVDKSPELAEKYGVMSIPTIIFFKHGKEMTRVIGATSKEHYQHPVEHLIAANES